MFKKFSALLLSLILILTVCQNVVFAIENDVDLPVMDDTSREVENVVYSEDFENVAEGSVKVPITNNTDGIQRINLWMVSTLQLMEHTKKVLIVAIVISQLKL